jgi:hypothetical protein
MTKPTKKIIRIFCFLSISYCEGNELNNVRRASNERIKQNVIKSSSCVDDKGY